ncbi:hypothetical protein [Sorangium sp. So ce1099]|uniref:hypothetical protein n=1 Tax=Sorangium sp. So ce1099 TaxID=3133331 RepID=UPI003F64671F
MLSNVARLLMASAAVSLVAFGPAPADACSDISDTALDFVADTVTPSVSSGAVFFTAVQKSAFDITSTDIAVLWGSTSPNSAQYYTSFNAGNHVTKITNASGIAAGDVLVIGATSSPSYSGHTAIITGPATQLTTALNPVFANTKQWTVPIADSTTSVHGCSTTFPDSRWTGNCTTGVFTPGEGTAFMRLYSDNSGNLQGYSWSVTSGATYYSPSTRPYVIGRLTPCPLL